MSATILGLRDRGTSEKAAPTRSFKSWNLKCVPRRPTPARLYGIVRKPTFRRFR